MIGELLVDIIRVGTTTLVISKISKVIGQKDIAEIIAGAGLIAVGLDVIILIGPVTKWIMDFTKIAGDTVKLFNEWGIAIGKFLNFGG